MLEAARAQAIAIAREDFERTVAILREENSTLRRMLEATAARADTLSIELARSLVVQAPALRPAPASVPPRRTSADPIKGLGNVLDPIPLGNPEGEFDSVRAASLMAAEDDDGVASAA